MTRKELRRIIKEEIIGRYQPSPLKNATETERMGELVIDDFFTLTSRRIADYVNDRADKYRLNPRAAKAVIAALDGLFTKQTLRDTIIRMHNIMSNNPQNRSVKGGR